MLIIDVDISDILRKLDRLEGKVAEALKDGITEGSFIVRADMTRAHYKGAHSVGRFETQTGNLIDQTKVVPTEINAGEVLGGVVAATPYAMAVEKGHGNAQPYPYGEPAVKSPTVKERVLAALKAHLKRVLGL